MIALTVVCAVGAAAAGGALFTFSDFTMNGLRGLPPAQGIAAMQAINRAAPSPLFMLMLFGTGVACIALMVLAGTRLEEPGAWLRIVASGTYLLSVVVLTIAYHVPRNDRLERVDPESAEGAAYWATYLREWVLVNHVRAAAPMAAAALFAASLTAPA